MKEPSEARNLAIRAGAGLTGAAAGLAVGGPFGALAGAVTPPILELLILREKRGLANIALLERLVIDLSGLSASELAAWAREKDVRIQLVTSVMYAAYASAVDRKISALARVLVDNLRDDALIDCSSLVIAALAQVEVPHIRVLHAMAHDVPPRHGALAGPTMWNQSELAAHVPALASGILPLVATLTATGMAVEGSESISPAPNDRCWTITTFGLACLARIEGPPSE